MSVETDGIDIIFDPEQLESGKIHNKSFLLGGLNLRFWEGADHKYIELSLISSKAAKKSNPNTMLTGYVPIDAIDEIIYALQRLKPAEKQLEFGSDSAAPTSIEALINSMEKEAEQAKFILSKPLYRKEVR